MSDPSCDRGVNRPEEFRPRRGDHIYVYRTPVPRLYTHHGIYIGSHKGKDNMVIHYQRPHSDLNSNSPSEPCTYCGYAPRPTGGVVESCLDCFLKGEQRLGIYQYNAGYIKFKPKGTCSFFPSKENLDLVVDEALRCLREGFGNYHLVLNNCEDFAHYCKTGWRFSAQSFYRSGVVPLGKTVLYPIAKGLRHMVDGMRENKCMP